MFLISKFFVGGIDFKESQNQLKTKIGKLFYLSVWISKIENSDNGTDFLVDMRFFTMKNVWQSIKVDSIIDHSDELIEYVDNILVDGFDEPKKCFCDNIKCVEYGVTADFIEKNKEYLYSVNTFCYQNIHKQDFLTWQESTILDMVSVSINKYSIIPIYSKKNIIIPDYTRWDTSEIKKIKDFFNNDIVDFVVETIDFIKNNQEPSEKVITSHCILLNAYIGECENVYKLANVSSYVVVSRLFSESIIKKINKNTYVIELIKTLQGIEDIDFLARLKDDGYPLNKNQNKSLKEYINNQYRSISSINEIHTFLDYLRNNKIAKYIDQENFYILVEKFYSFVEDIRNQIVPTVFFEYMIFLINVNAYNQYVDCRKVKYEMIDAQENWQNIVYPEQCKNMHIFSKSSEIPSETVKAFNNILCINPMIIAESCILSTESKILEAIKQISENPFVLIIKRMYLSAIYPIEMDKIKYERHEVDNMMREQVEKIKETYSYKLLNVMDTDVYVTGIHEMFKRRALITLAYFNEDEKLYNYIIEQSEIELLPYNKNVSLGHLTQLFPVLEIKIRELGKAFGIFSFKESLNDFMKFKDPSSILREILELVYEEINSFENIPDLLFVYHFMYNGNSLNVRNECIHGRDYNKGGRLIFGFKVTLISIYMIMYRLKIIEENLDRDIED